ncbi:hypothetical protein NP493_283g02000 [Ridgeia piscesae]|uniref:Peptidase M14 domain-containing protein n=1 Tax=Ridgeia piscesae TaxID=27915 RepID=A0AAD9NX53_RIDPI|nr:hypothetical protein NP493_283g02000 [Ridgeia piscesae]
MILLDQDGVSALYQSVSLVLSPDRTMAVKASLAAHNIHVKVVVDDLQKVLNDIMKQNDEARQRQLVASESNYTESPARQRTRMSNAVYCLLRFSEGKDWQKWREQVLADPTWRTWICSGVPPNKPPVQPEHYMNTTEIVRWLTQAGNASSIAKTFSIGNSYEGRPTMCMKINDENQSLPIVWVDAGMHAREWISVSTAIYLIHRILFGKDSDAIYLRKNFRWYIVPNSNPDGYDYSWKHNRLWRKTRVPHTERCNGTDLNRNFGFHWGETGGCRGGDPCSDVYRGPKPFSDVESRNLRDAIWPLRTDTKLLLNLHSYHQSWLLPFTGLVSKTNDYDALKTMADKAVASLKSIHGKVFQVGRLQDFFYRVSGTELDWAKGVANITYAYVLELRPHLYADGGFTASPSNIVPSGEEIFAALVTCCRSL